MAQSDDSSASERELSKAEAHDKKVDEDSQPLLSHLIDLRKSILRALLVVLVVFLCLFPFANELHGFISAPLQRFLPGEMIATDVASPFLTPFKLSAWLSIFLSMPVILYYIWRFVAPGLYLREKKFAIPLLVSSVLLFYLGIVFAYYTVFPLVFQFMAATAPENVVWMTDIRAYLDFIIKLVFAFGIVFEIPIAIMLVVMMGISTPKSIAKKRPYIIVGCFFVGMILTPPDVISQVLLAVPAWILFELGLIFARLVVRRREAIEADEVASTD